MCVHLFSCFVTFAVSRFEGSLESLLSGKWQPLTSICPSFDSTSSPSSASSSSSSSTPHSKGNKQNPEPATPPVSESDHIPSSLCGTRDSLGVVDLLPTPLGFISFLRGFSTLGLTAVEFETCPPRRVPPHSGATRGASIWRRGWKTKSVLVLGSLFLLTVWDIFDA